MTITIATQPATDRLADTASMPEPVELAAGLFFQPSRVMEEARRLAADGVDVVVTMSLAVLDQAPVTGTSRSLLEASVENRLRSALYAAGSRRCAAALLARSPRDWGTLTPFASAVQHLPELLRGEVRWEGPDVVVPSAAEPTLWLFGDIIREDRLVAFPQERSRLPGDLARFSAGVMSARAAFRQGRYRDAERDAAELVRRRSEDRHLWLLVLARCAADAGSPLDATRLLGAVAGTQERFGLPWLPQLLVTARSEAEQLGRDALGHDAFNHAYAEGFELDLEAAVAYALRARGERKRPSTGWDSLTPTELQVAEQVAAGQTNAEIATALLMAHTTVKTHLAHIFTKLNCTNRAELAAEVTRRA